MPLMTLPGMRERGMRIGWAGKTFSLTGWKVGYITAAPRLMSRIAKAHQYMTFTTPPNLQRGVAAGLRKGDGYFAGLAADLQRKRDRLASAWRKSASTCCRPTAPISSRPTSGRWVSTATTWNSAATSPVRPG